jgi:hypothetical protein
MSVKYRVWKMRRDGVTQRYWIAPTREHDDAVTAVISGDLALADSRREQELARQLMQTPSVLESVYRSLVRQYPETESKDAQSMLFLQHYLSRGYSEAEALLVRLATEPSNWNVRSNAIYTITTSMNPRVPRLIREVLDKAPDELTVSTAITDLVVYLGITMENLIFEGITPAREAILDTLETLGLAMQGKWGRLEEGEIDSILSLLKYNPSRFEQAVQGQIPARVEKTLADGLMSVLSIESLSTDEFEQTLEVIKEWRSAYSLRKLRSLLSDAFPQQRRQMIIDAINEIEHQLKRKSG